MAARLFVILVVLLIAFQISYSQEKVKGGFTKCEVYRYNYKEGKIDLNSKFFPSLIFNC